MGAFFTNVHVRAKPGDSLDPLSRALVEAAAGDGLAPCAEGDAPDRTILIFGPDERGWVSIYDERTEGQDPTTLDALAAIASIALRAPAITVLVHDSDVLCSSLFDGGKCVDRYDSFPRYFGEAEGEDAADLAGHPARWADLLGPGLQPETLRAIWDGKKIFAEQTLAETARALGAPPERMGVGYRYLDPETSAKAAVALRFRLLARPAYEVAAEGPTALATQMGETHVPARFAVGDELRVALTTQNQGGASRGLLSVAWGDAIDRGLVEVDRFEILIGNVREGARHQAVAPSARDHEGGKLLVAELPEAELPAGVAGGSQAMAGGGDGQRAFAAMQRAQVHVNVVGRIVQAGSAALHVGLVPLANLEGQAAITYDLALAAPPWRPLRARPETPSQLLLPLSMRRLLCAFVVFPARSEEVIRHAARSFEGLAALSPAATAFDTTVFHAEPGRRPETQSVAGAGFLRSARFQELVAKMLVEQVVTVQEKADMTRFSLEDAATGVMPMPGFGVSFGGSILPQEEPETAVLSLWVNVEALAEAQVAALRAYLAGIVQDAMDRLGALQALLARWGTAPTSNLDTTPCEAACGIHQGTLRPSWASRWLRAVGNEATWLGASLLSHVDPGARERLAQVAEVHQGAGWLRVEARPGDSLTEIEMALAGLLPGHEDWLEASRRKT